jgi:hypothetical protein
MLPQNAIFVNALLLITLFFVVYLNFSRFANPAELWPSVDAILHFVLSKDDRSLLR